MNPVDIIVKKRDGGQLTTEEIHFFIEGFSRGAIPDYQAAAWAMAIYFQGMTPEETTALTLAMAESGERLDQHDGLPPGTIIVDKHSSGGVGDKTSLVVGPVVAACGLPVGKMSGRGLSYSGGTIDKLESIPGWSAALSPETFRRQLREIGLVIAGQTADLAPADKQLYALRDVTGTVPSLPLIVSSIMSKKLAAGADAIVLDVKCGQGAFMPDRVQAEELARLMVQIGVQAGRRMTALVTQMEQPLGLAVGNSLEVQEAIQTLHGAGPADFVELVENVAAEMLVLGGLSAEREQALDQVRQAIDSGAGLEKFAAFVTAQGGDGSVVFTPAKLATGPVKAGVFAPHDGWVKQIDAREVGLTVVELGGGRHKKGDVIDFRVGVLFAAKVGGPIGAGDLLCTVYAADDAGAQMAAGRLQAAIALSHQPVPPLPVIYSRRYGLAESSWKLRASRKM